MGALVLVGFVVGLDNFRVAVGLGTLKLTCQRRTQIALAFCLCEALAPLVGLTIGQVLVESIRPWVEAIGPIMLGGCGVYVIYRTLRHEDANRILDNYWVGLGLPLSLSLDNLLAGMGLGMLGQPVLLAAAVIGAISGMMCMAGLMVGSTVVKFSLPHADLFSGAMLLFLAVTLMIGD